MNPMIELIAALRGEPSKCDWCGQPKTLEELIPEEAGEWICFDCDAKSNYPLQEER